MRAYSSRNGYVKPKNFVRQMWVNFLFCLVKLTLNLRHAEKRKFALITYRIYLTCQSMFGKKKIVFAVVANVIFVDNKFLYENFALNCEPQCHHQ